MLSKGHGYNFLRISVLSLSLLLSSQGFAQGDFGTTEEAGFPSERTISEDEMKKPKPRDQQRSEERPKPMEPKAPEPVIEDPVSSDDLPPVERPYGIEARLLFPEVAGLGFSWKPSDRWQIGLEGAYFSVPFLVVNAGIRTWGAFGLWHPYDGAFYLGGGLGQQRLSLDIGDSIIGFKTGLSSNVTTNYMRGYVGWQWITERGFSWGFRLGLQAPLKATTATDLNVPGANESDIQTIKDHPRYRDLKDGLETAGEYLGESWVPLFSVIHLGWYF